MPRWRWKGGRVTRRQSAAVVETLGAGAADTVRLLALHHPPFVGGLERLVGRARLVTALVEAGVDLVLAGHTHVPEARAVELAAGGRRHRIVEVVAGTATSRRTRGSGRSWTLIRIDADAVDVSERYQVDSGWRNGGTARFNRQP
jgi:3',5'-cyclic AMP phosphodiesterase CpdA